MAISVSERAHQIELIHGDIHSIALDGNFDFIICALNTLQEFHSVHAQQTLLRRISKLLTAQGVSLFDVQIIPQFVLYEACQPQQRLFHRYTLQAVDENVASITKNTSERYDVFSQTMSTHAQYWVKHRSGEVEYLYTTDLQHIYSVREIELLFESTPLEICATWGSYDLDAFDGHSASMLWEARRSIEHVASTHRINSLVAQ